MRPLTVVFIQLEARFLALFLVPSEINNVFTQCERDADVTLFLVKVRVQIIMVTPY